MKKIVIRGGKDNERGNDLHTIGFDYKAQNLWEVKEVNIKKYIVV